MHKTTVYLPDDLRAALREAAEARQTSEAALIRQAIAHEVTAGQGRPRPGIIATTSGQGGAALAQQVDEELGSTGFGE